MYKQMKSHHKIRQLLGATMSVKAYGRRQREIESKDCHVLTDLRSKPDDCWQSCRFNLAYYIESSEKPFLSGKN